MGGINSPTTTKRQDVRDGRQYRISTGLISVGSGEHITATLTNDTGHALHVDEYDAANDEGAVGFLELHENPTTNLPSGDINVVINDRRRAASPEADVAIDGAASGVGDRMDNATGHVFPLAPESPPAPGDLIIPDGATMGIQSLAAGGLFDSVDAIITLNVTVMRNE